ncbi:EAL domain-containing protein [Neptunomonas japonica]|uniref:EAL domain-containing protein n=1 Tax=Neptunomonas japonica TaxID=417574 RepID=UPI00040642EA|nr:EAL domain-containing protein [Neptunomonas japonica]
MNKIKKTGSIANKLLLMLVGISTLSAMITASVLFVNEWFSATNEQRKNLTSIAEILEPNLITAVMFDDNQTVNELINPLNKRQEIIYSSVSRPDGSIITSIGDRKAYLTLGENLNEYIIIKNRLVFDNQDFGKLLIMADKSYVENRSQFYLYFLIVLILANFVICFIISLSLRKRFVAPIIQLASLAKKVSSNRDYSLRAKKITDDEIADLTGYFNQMLNTIEERDQYLETQVFDRTKEIELANKNLRLQAYNDSLTGLPNRHFFYEKLQRTIDYSSRYNLKFSLIFIDLDNFKEINDTLGHDYGDLLLIKASRRLVECVRETDTVARLGGDEFTLIIQDLSSKERINAVAENILKCLAQSFQLKDERVFVSGSIGVTVYPDDGDNVESLVKHADQAMYESKHAGRNCYRFFTSELQVNAQNKKMLSDDLRRATYENEFILCYQPIIELKTNEVTKAEALVRWNHPSKGIIRPSQFIPLAEEMGLISEVSSWVAEHALKQSILWRSMTRKEIPISINTSALLYKGDPTWIENWLQQLKANHIPGNMITIEITESLLMESNDSIKSQLITLRDHGVEVSIDDFGVGYSSLSYLQELDIDVLKIDQSFVKGIERGNDSLALCEAVIVMAHRIGLKVIAEGIETAKQHELLLEAGCDYGQGYYYSKPILAMEFTKRFIAVPAEMLG